MADILPIVRGFACFGPIWKKNIVKQINVVVCVNIAVVVEWSFLGLNICFDNMQFKYACIFVYNSILFQL